MMGQVFKLQELVEIVQDFSTGSISFSKMCFQMTEHRRFVRSEKDYARIRDALPFSGK